MSTYAAIIGPDGAGKTTLINHFRNYSIKTGEHIEFLREPTGTTEESKLIYSYLKTGEPSISKEELIELFIKDRQKNLENVKFFKDNGAYIIQDRCYICNAAYQADNIDEFNAIIQKNITQPWFIHPDIIIYLCAEIDLIMNRIDNRAEEKTMFEKKEKLSKVIALYDYYCLENLSKDRNDESKQMITIVHVDESTESEDLFSLTKNLIFCQ